MKKINIITFAFLSAVLSACGGGSGGPDKPDVCKDLTIEHCNELIIPASSSSSSASSEAPPVNNLLPFTENFAVDNASQFFNQAYKPLLNPNLEDPNNAFYYATSGLDSGRIVAAGGKLTIGNARFTIGQRLQKTGTHINPDALPLDYKSNTTTAINAANFPTTTTWGDLDLSHKWKISFCVKEKEALTGSTSNQQFMIYVDNNQSASLSSIHKTDSLVTQINVTNFVAGKRVEFNIPGDITVGGVSVDSITQNPGATSSFIQLRVPSAGVVTMSDLWIGYQSNTASEPAGSTCTVGTRVPNWNIALPPAVPVAPSFQPGNQQLTVTWPVAAGAATYTLAWSTTNSVEGATLIEGITGTSTTITGLQNGTTYYVFVKSVNTGGVSAFGPSAAGVPAAPATPPVTPTGVTLYGDANRVLVAWSPTDGAQTYSLAVNTMNETSTASVVTDITDTYKRVGNLVKDAPYYFFVKAVNAVGGSEYSAAKVVTLHTSPYIYEANLHVSRDYFFGVNGPAVQTITADSEIPMHYVAGGGAGITLNDTAGTLTLASGGRFTIGQSVASGAVQVNTTAADTSVPGVLDLSGHYKIYITVVSAPDNAGLFQVYLDNNTTGSANSMLAAKSRLLNRTASTITDGEVIVIDVSGANRLGSAHSFIQLRTDATLGTEGVIISGIRIEAVDAPIESSSSSAASSLASSAASSALSSVAASSIASSSTSSDVSSIASSSVSSVSSIASSAASSLVSSISSVASSAASSSVSSASSVASSSASSDTSSTSSSAASGVTKNWGFDSAAYALADTTLFAAAYNAAADNNIKATSSDVSVDGLIFNSTAVNVLRYRPAGSTSNASASPLWNTNGSFFTSNSVLMPAVGGDIDTTKLRTYIAVPVTAGTAFTITVDYKQTGSGATAAKVALVGSDNKVLAAKDASFGSAAGTGDSITISVPAGHAYTSIKILYGREGITTGGVNITNIQRVQ